MDKMGLALPHQDICSTSTEDTLSLRCHTGNDGAPSIQRRAESNQPKNPVVRL